jgi:hypothetical protein
MLKEALTEEENSINASFVRNYPYRLHPFGRGRLNCGNSASSRGAKLMDRRLDRAALPRGRHLRQAFQALPGFSEARPFR